MRINRLISLVIQGKDDMPRISLAGIHSRVRLSRVVVKSVQSSSADFPKWSDKKSFGLISFLISALASQLCERPMPSWVFVYVRWVSRVPLLRQSHDHQGRGSI